MLNCVGFVGEYIELPTGEGSIDPQGSGFFVNIPSVARPANQYFAFVTAKHVAVSLQNRMTVISVNKKGGGIAVLEDTDDKWYLHPDPTVDVAVMAFTPKADLDIKSFPIAGFATPSMIDEQQIGIGDEVYVPGLFTYVASESRNVPILRHGNIAMMAGEPIQVDEGFAEVHLIEARSIGGMSGSPVFVRGTVSVRGKEDRMLHGLSGTSALLGLIHGHWDIKEAEINNPTPVHDAKRGVNLGIAVVVPATKILEVINHPGLVGMREQADNELKKAISPEPDSSVK